MTEKVNGVANNSFEMEDGFEFKSLTLETKKTELENEKFTEPKTSNLSKIPQIIKYAMPYFLHIIVIAYFSYATYKHIDSENNECNGVLSSPTNLCGMRFCTGYGMLLILICLSYFGLAYYYLFKPRYGAYWHRNYIIPLSDWWSRFSRTRAVSGIIITVVLILIAIFVYFETKYYPEKLAGLTAPIFFFITGYIFSTNRSAINWRIVLTGILGQFLLCIFCIRLEFGRKIFLCIGDKMTTFLNFAQEGAQFVYGETLTTEKVFAFSTLATVFFISFFVSVLYYLNVMQWIILRLGWILSNLVGSTVCVCVIAGANIFLGMSESPLLIKPYCSRLTRAEFHAIMVSGFATVSGSVLAAYLAYGASAPNLITSSVMAAPAAIAWAHLYWPETEESKTTNDNIQLEKSEDSSLLDAAATGASTAIPIVLGIAANIIAFVSFIAFLNALVGWLGILVGLEDISFEWIFSKLFIPLAWAMGISWADCDIVAKVVATKSMINEFVAYERLGTYFRNHQITERSMGITTFAICGFANPGSIGILVGSFNVLAPSRRKDITAVAFRAFVVGSIVCFVSASFAGILMPDELERYTKSINETEFINTTLTY